MDHARVCQKIETCDGISNEELVRQHVALHPITRAACHDQVAWHVRATAREWVDVVDSGDSELERRAAIDAAAAAVAHHGALERALLLAAAVTKGFTVKAARAAREWGDDAVKSMS